MGINYVIVCLVLAAVILLIVWLFRRNQKDRKDFERKINLFDLDPQKHDDEEV